MPLRVLRARHVPAPHCIELRSSYKRLGIRALALKPLLHIRFVCRIDRETQSTALYLRQSRPAWIDAPTLSPVRWHAQSEQLLQHSLLVYSRNCLDRGQDRLRHYFWFSSISSPPRARPSSHSTA